MLKVELYRPGKTFWAKWKGHWILEERTLGADSVPIRVSEEDLAERARAFFLAGCTRGTLHLEDVILVIPESSASPRPVVAFNCITGTCHQVILAPEAIGALIYLALGGTEDESCYELLGPTLTNWPTESDPIGD